MAGASDDVLREPFLHKMTANHYTCVLIFRHLFSHPLLKVCSGDPTKIISSQFHCQKNETFQLKKVVALKHYLQIHSIHLVSHSIACYRHTRQTTIVQVSCIACVSMICSLPFSQQLYKNIVLESKQSARNAVNLTMPFLCANQRIVRYKVNKRTGGGWTVT